MAAEAEHVCPGRKPQPFQVWELAEAEAFGEAAGVVANGKVGQLVGGGDAAVEGACAFGGFGCVLGDVAGDSAVGQFPGGGDRAGVDFTSPCERPGREARGGRDIQVDGAGGLFDGGGEQGKGRPGGRGRRRPGGAIEPDDGVEVAAEPVAGSRPGTGWCSRGWGQWTKAVLLSSGPCGRSWTSGGKPQPGAEVSGSLISGAMPHLAWPEPPATQAVHWCVALAP